MSVILHIEALIFASEKPVTREEIKSCFEDAIQFDISTDELDDAIEAVVNKYESNDFAIQVVKIANGYTFMTKSEYHESVATLLKLASQKKLSTAALETLSIVAYKQPVTKSEMESIRGVNSDYTIQKLLEKDLVEITGRRDGPGKPLLYGTSQKFMDYFGLKSIDDLPKLKDFESVENTIGDHDSIIENEDGATVN
jgi:segregation and condensation protein B